jgi:hypothetical protein
MIKLISLIYFSTKPCLDCPQNNAISSPLHSPLVAHPSPSLIHWAHMFQVDCSVFLVVWGPPNARSLFYFIFLVLFLPPQTIKWCPPVTFCHGCAPSTISHPPRMPPLSCLLCCLTKWQPSKAKTLPLSLYLMCHL